MHTPYQMIFEYNDLQYKIIGLIIHLELSWKYILDNSKTNNSLCLKNIWLQYM